jgi:hypothetical protein
LFATLHQQKFAKWKAERSSWHSHATDEKVIRITDEHTGRSADEMKQQYPYLSVLELDGYVLVLNAPCTQRNWQTATSIPCRLVWDTVSRAKFQDTLRCLRFDVEETRDYKVYITQ